MVVKVSRLRMEGEKKRPYFPTKTKREQLASVKKGQETFKKERPFRNKEDVECAHPCCKSPAYARNLCQACYRAWMRKFATGKCKIRGCTAPYDSRGLCATHYQRYVEGRPLEAPVKKKKSFYDHLTYEMGNSQAIEEHPANRQNRKEGRIRFSA